MLELERTKAAGKDFVKVTLVRMLSDEYSALLDPTAQLSFDDAALPREVPVEWATPLKMNQALLKYNKPGGKGLVEGKWPLKGVLLLDLAGNVPSVRG